MGFWYRWSSISKNQNRHSVTGKYTTDEGASQSQKTKAFVDSLPDDPNKPGYKATPIPRYEGTIGPVDRTNYKMQNVKVADLKTRQPFIEAKRVKQFDRSKLPDDDSAHPLVIHTRDHQMVIDNGNHRVSHMHAIGMKETPARVVHEIHGYGNQGEGSVP